MQAATRPIRDRLRALFGRAHEPLSPRALRRTLADLRTVVDPRVSEVEAGRRAKDLAAWYATATADQRRDCWLLMSEQFGPDPRRIRLARDHYEISVGTPAEGAAEIRLRRAIDSPRARLLQRFAAFPDGMRFLIDLRAELQPHVRGDTRLLPLDAELETLFSTWFDVAFLDLRRITWDSPASLIEKLIRYEAVHEIRGWDDVKHRLGADRRCYAFFHPRLPNEPLIFVEVALTEEISASIPPLIDEAAPVLDTANATTAIFYSISNTQSGLRGVSFGDSLIKRVVETLQEEFPRLKTFATLSPIPGLRAWIDKHAPADVQAGTDRATLLPWAARYLGTELVDGKPLDAVARFHLGNGARIERLNWAADPSPKGMKQSFGLMVNYLYDLKRLDRHREMLSQGQIPMSSAIEDLYRRAA